MKELFDISQYNYALPDERIARHPLENRDESKLLLWEKGQISHRQFYEAPELIPEGSLLVFNDTKVISARLIFTKTTGAQIEIFLLHPELPTRDIQESMTLESPITWQCMIGNKKKWKTGTLAKQIGNHQLTANYHDREESLVTFSWTGNTTFADIINKSGETPLPPYLHRKPVAEDSERYQTVYSKNDGAVAAPTAGLHFTNDIINKVKLRGIGIEYLTLHVSAGTFKPVEASDFRNHEMHQEQIIIKKKSIINLLNNHSKVVAVGTTSLRIMESLYWFGVKLKENQETSFTISKTFPYQNRKPITFPDALEEVIGYCEILGLQDLHGETELFIYPGYKIRSATGIFTNFHLPKSTLLLLVSSFVNGEWKNIYNEALENNYRFLSYGDSSLLLR